MIHFENLPRLAHSNTYFDFVFHSVMLCAFFVAETIGEVQDLHISLTVKVNLKYKFHE